MGESGPKAFPEAYEMSNASTVLNAIQRKGGDLKLEAEATARAKIITFPKSKGSRCASELLWPEREDRAKIEKRGKRRRGVTITQHNIGRIRSTRAVRLSSVGGSKFVSWQMAMALGSRRKW